MRMITWLFAPLVVSLLLMTGCKSISGGQISSDRDLNEWRMNYYRRPRPEATLSALQYMDESKATHRRERQSWMVSFLAMIFRYNPEVLSEVFEETGEFHLMTRHVIWFAAWEADTAEAREQLRSSKHACTMTSRIDVQEDDQP